MWRCLSISRSLLTMRKPRMMSVTSTKSLNIERRRSRSRNGIRTWVSGPIGKPMLPSPATSRRQSASKLTPSSSGQGDDQVRTSSIQVADIVASPMLGTTAIGLPACTDDREPGPCRALPERSVESGEVANIGFGAYQDRGDFAFGHLCLTASGSLREFVGWKASLRTQDIPLVARQRDCSLSR